jgi:hypothetical protein
MNYELQKKKMVYIPQAKGCIERLWQTLQGRQILRRGAGRADLFCVGVYAFNFGNFSLNVAPAVSILFVNAENRESIFKRVTLFSVLV